MASSLKPLSIFTSNGARRNRHELDIFPRGKFLVAGWIFSGEWHQQVLRQALNLAAQHGDRTFGQCHYGASSSLDSGSDRRVVRLGVGSRTGRVPNVLLASERHHVHLAVKEAGLAAGPLEGDLNLVRVIPVFIHKQKRPVAIGPSNRIGRSQARDLQDHGRSRPRGRGDACRCDA